MSGTQVSAWQTPNELLTSMETPAIVQRNQLLNQEAQQTINANEMEQISRASNWVISQDPENKDPAKQAAAYGAAVKLLRANNFAKNAPEQYLGFDAMQMMARQGTPSAEQFKVGENRAALAALAPGATPSTTAPTTDGGGGGGTSDNNFGNIRPTGASSGFNTYATPQEGVAAMSSNLAAYASKHGINTLNGLTARWAPKGDGNNDPAAYAASLGKMLGLDPNAEINLADPLLQSRLIPAMAQIEKGRPFSQPRDVLLAGIQAGLGGAAPAAAPGGGVAARNPGAVQVAGPGAGAPAATTAPPAAYATAPTKEAATAQAIATGKPVLIEGGQGAAALPSGRLVANLPDLPAAPAATAPAATAPPPPPQVALPPRPPIGQDGLQDAQRRELAVLRATGRIAPADYIARQEQMVSHNDALLQQWQTDVRQAQNDALTRQDKAVTQAQAAATQQREEATSRREAAKAVDLILEGGDDGSQRYAAAYATKAAPRVNVDGSKVFPVMTAYDKPTYRGGKGQVAEGGAAPDYAAQTVTPPTQMNATEQRIGSFADAMLRSNPTINQTEDVALNWAERAGARVGDYVGFNVNSPEYQQYNAAKENFINAVVRPESGAVVNKDEYVRYDRMYFPQPGESAATVKLKREFREDKIQETIRQAGPAYKPTAAPAAEKPTKTMRYDHNGNRVND